MAPERLIYLPLGGAGEIGMNAYVYGYGRAGAERLVLVDAGVTFGDMDGTPGIDLIMPDMTWLEERADRLEAIVITHGHEDHLGGLAHLWPRLRVPVYARAFTAALARLKFKEYGLPLEMIRTVGAWPETHRAGPFAFGFLPVSHSIPEAGALVLDTQAGRVLHSGDFKLDLDPVVGEPFDAATWRAVAEPGLQALICDSTNVFTPHAGRSESSLAEPLTELMRSATGLVGATTFASNVARLMTLARAGVAAGRVPVLLGRAMNRMVSVAEEVGVLKGFPRTASPEEARDLPREKVLLLATGSQGERRAATAQLATGKYLGFELKEGDTFLFSSFTIPGNERGVIRLLNAFSEKGVDVIAADPRYHVSGHANRPDLEAVHELLRPRMLVPNHGEHRHLRAHVALGRAAGLKAALAPNGTMLDLSGTAPRVVEHVETGRTYLDGSALIGALDGVVRDRMRMAIGGLVIVALMVDEDGEPDAWVATRGLPSDTTADGALGERLEQALGETLARTAAADLEDDEALEKIVQRKVRDFCMREVGKKPECEVMISRLSSD